MTARHSASRPGGFTLVEVMLALGILALALPMVGMAFLSASMENRDSIETTMATVIGENGVGVAGSALRHVTFAIPPFPPIPPLNGIAGVVDVTEPVCRIRLADRAYPTARTNDAQDWFTSEKDGQDYPSSRYGWLAAVRQPVVNVNDYQLYIVPYRKHAATDRPGHEVKFTTTTVTGGRVADAAIGAPVILKDTGAFAFVTDATGSLSVLLDDGAALTVSNPGGVSAAIGCTVARVAIRP